MDFVKIVLTVFIIFNYIGFANAGTIQYNAGALTTDGSSDQIEINQALENGGEVYLGPDVYTIDGPINVKSNTIFTGDPEAVIKVSSSSSQWFVEGTGLINNIDSLKNVEIYGFQIDGNLDELPRSFADYGNGDHNAERAIYFVGNKKDFMENVSIHDLEIYDTYSDGVQLAYCKNAQVYSNFISNCQHSGIFLISVIGANIFKNDVAGITSDCLRLDNCVNNFIFDNILYSYTGDNLQGQGTNGENGLQIADEGYSHGGGSAKPTHTTNIEVYNNTFANTGWHGIWLDSTGKGVDNVYIHDNKFLEGEELETAGIPVKNDISFNNPPTKELSKEVFSSIFDILNISFMDTGRTEQKEESIRYSVQEAEQGRISGGIKIIGFNDTIKINNVSYIPDNNSILVKSVAMPAPSLNLFMETSKIKKTIDTRIENGTAYATLTVEMTYYKTSTNYKTGEISKHKHTTKAVFNDSMPAPMILKRPKELRGSITEYPTHTLVFVPSQGLTKLKFEYKGNISEHVFLTGEREKNENGVEYTNFSKVNYWKGDIPHYSEYTYLTSPFDPEKLTVTAYTPYEDFQVINFDYVKKDFPAKFVSDWLLPSFGLFLILGFGAWYYIKKILY